MDHKEFVQYLIKLQVSDEIVCWVIENGYSLKEALENTDSIYFLGFLLNHGCSTVDEKRDVVDLDKLEKLIKEKADYYIKRVAGKP